MMSKRETIFAKKFLIMGIALLIFVGGILGFSTVAHAAGEQVVVPIASERNITVAASQSAFVAPNIELNNFGFQIGSAKIVIENLPGDAYMTYTNVSGLTVLYDSAKMVYTITGTADASDYKTLFRSFKINCGTTLRNDIKFNFLVSGNTTTPMYYSGTGHYYEYISRGAAPRIDWTDAVAEASGMTYNGMQGYMVTITSAGENAFVVNKMAESGWIGASDPTATGVWTWATGPEAGTQFWQGYRPGAGAPVGGQYNNWQINEPNKDTPEGNYAHIILEYPNFIPGEWNDMPNSNTFVKGYAVEYGGMPGDAPEDFDETVTVNIGASVTYNANGATSGDVPTDSNSPYAPSSNVGVLTNSGTLAKTGYTFTGWNTQSDGQGTHYDATGTDSFTIYSNVTLYAEWGCSVTYDANGATSGDVPTDNNSPYAPSSNVGVLTNSGTLAKTGFVFTGWNTQANGQGTHYDATGTDSFMISSNVTLYAEWGCSVTYDSNGASSGDVPTDNSSPYAPSSNVGVLTNSGTLAKTGFVFTGWNTQANGQGTHYDATGTDSFMISSNVTLYAEWGCSVTYDSNGASSGDVPTDNSSPYAPSSNVGVLTNSGTLAKTGFVFTGWNTQSDGQGTHYDATGTDSFTISSNVTLYAEWGCSVTYDSNGATSGDVPTDNSSPYAPSSNVGVLTNSGSLAKTGYTFSGWNTQADGQGTHYDATGTDSFMISSNVTLYAEWGCSVTYDANGASSGDVPTDNNSPYAPSSNVGVLTNSGTLAKTGYTFSGWNTQADGQGTHYDATGTDSFMISSNVTLYAEWGCSVTYDSNGASSGDVPTDNSSPYAPSSNVGVLTNSGTLAKTGYTFSGWNTQADGQGTHYDATGSALFTISSNVTLYAEWGCSVTYDSNGATNGTVPTDDNSPYAPSSNVGVLTNSGTLAKTGFVFTGWNTQSDGQGTHYDATGSVSFTISSNVTLYAEWGCSVTYDANDATSGDVPTDNGSPYAPSSNVGVLTNSGSLAKTGYTFSGWNTQADGQGTHYDATGTDSFTISSNVTLYAEWGCSVTYDANGATSGNVPTDNSSPYAPSSNVGVLTNSGTLAKTGYTFSGWNTQSDGQGTHYDATGLASFEISSNITLYAEWGCSVTYDSNGATNGTVPTDNNSPYAPSSNVGVLTNSGTLAKTGYTFSGWNTQADGQGTHYDATGLASFEISSNITLYAEWGCNVTYDANGATSGNVPTDDNSPYASSSTVTVLTNSGTLAKTGYTFSGWNTQADGKGTHYGATGADAFTISYNITLYAEWRCSVTYDANGATSGTVPTDNSSPYASSSTVTVLTNSGTLEKTGYVFDGWNTQADGQGTHYDEAGFDSFEISSNVILYAEWARDTDYDGVSDEDEVSAGTSPNDPHDRPQKGTINVTVYQQDGSPAEGLTCVLYSTPVVVTTDANGTAVFSNVDLAPHTLILRNGNGQLGTYSLNFTKGSANSTDINDNASTDSDGSVSSIVASNFLSLNLTIQQNESNFWQIEYADNTQSPSSAVNYGRVDNPQTGDYGTDFIKLWMLVATLLIGGCVMTGIAIKKKQANTVASRE